MRVRVGLLDDRAGRLVVWDPKAEGVAGVLELGAGTRLRAVASTGAYAAVQRDGEALVRFVYGGVAAVSHGDHVDLLKGKPELLATVAEARRTRPCCPPWGLRASARGRRAGVRAFLRLSRRSTAEGPRSITPAAGEHGAAGLRRRASPSRGRAAPRRLRRAGARPRGRRPRGVA